MKMKYSSPSRRRPSPRLRAGRIRGPRLTILPSEARLCAHDPVRRFAASHAIRIPRGDVAGKERLDMHPVALAFSATLVAGLSTGIGSLIALLSKKTTARFLSIALGFSAGVMIFVSLGELFGDSVRRLSVLWGPRGGYWGALGGFFGGMALIALIDRLVPPAVNPHEARAREAARYEAPDAKVCPDENASGQSARLMRMGFLTATVITIHNFPEGIAAFFATLESPRFGAAIAFAIATHNIPEGYPSRSRSTTPQARAAGPSGTASPPAFPSPWAPPSASCSSATASTGRCSGSSSRRSPAS